MLRVKGASLAGIVMGIVSTNGSGLRQILPHHGILSSSIVRVYASSKCPSPCEQMIQSCSHKGVGLDVRGLRNAPPRHAPLLLLTPHQYIKPGFIPTKAITLQVRQRLTKQVPAILSTRGPKQHAETSCTFWQMDGWSAILGIKKSSAKLSG